MTNINLIEQKINYLKRIFSIIKRYRRFSLKEIQNSDDIKGMIERYLYLLCQATIDLGEMVIGYKKLPQPNRAGDTFDILCEDKIISRPLAEKMHKVVGFRNVLAHDYVEIDYAKLYEILQKDSDDVNEFVLKIKKI